MQENTADARPVRASQEHHGVTFEQPMTGENDVRALCLCGWASPWGVGRKQARQAGVAHLALVTASLRDLIEEVVTQPGVQEALAGLTPEQLEKIRSAVAAELGEQFVRETQIGAGR